MWTTKAWVTSALNDSYLPDMMFPQHWHWEFWLCSGVNSSRCFEGYGIYVITVVYLCVTFHVLYCLFVWCSRLGLMPLPNSQSSVTLSTHNSTSPWLVFNYMLWNASFCMTRLWLTTVLCSNLCYSYWKKNLPVYLHY